MNLHGIVFGSINAINPFITCSAMVSTGSTTNPDGSRTPTYTNITFQAQVQPLSYTDIVMIEGMNIQGVRRKFYLTGDIEGLVRVNKRGGDIITMPPEPAFPTGSRWLVVLVTEHWPDWVAVIGTLQE